MRNSFCSIFFLQCVLVVQSGITVVDVTSLVNVSAVHLGRNAAGEILIQFVLQGMMGVMLYLILQRGCSVIDR